jgi:hypothetical protein
MVAWTRSSSVVLGRVAGRRLGDRLEVAAETPDRLASRDRAFAEGLSAEALAQLGADYEAQREARLERRDPA